MRACRPCRDSIYQGFQTHNNTLTCSSFISSLIRVTGSSRHSSNNDWSLCKPPSESSCATPRLSTLIEGRVGFRLKSLVIGVVVSSDKTFAVLEISSSGVRVLIFLVLEGDLLSQPSTKSEGRPRPEELPGKVVGAMGESRLGSSWSISLKRLKSRESSTSNITS